LIGLLQRVTSSSVRIDGQVVAEIGAGLLVLVGIERDDGPAQARRLAERTLAYRLFADDGGKMNLSVAAIDGEVLVVPQFTLVADTARGNRPGFSRGADPATGERLFARLVEEFRAQGARVAAGRFGADMKVGLVNDGPVTFLLRVSA
jgi:D-aminoacyl-tRNA deacylase